MTRVESGDIQYTNAYRLAGIGRGVFEDLGERLKGSRYTMPNNIYLADANIFLEPSKKYYGFKIAPGYWKQFNIFAEQGYIKTIDLVESELSPRDNEEFKDDIQL